MKGSTWSAAYTVKLKDTMTAPLTSQQMLAGTGTILHSEIPASELQQTELRCDRHEPAKRHDRLIPVCSITDLLTGGRPSRETATRAAGPSSTTVAATAGTANAAANATATCRTGSETARRALRCLVNANERSPAILPVALWSQELALTGFQQKQDSPRRNAGTRTQRVATLSSGNAKNGQEAVAQ